MEYEKNAEAELNSMTKFIHSVHQPCAEWIPSSHLEYFTSWDDVGTLIPCHPYWGIAGQGDYNINEYEKFINSDYEITDVKYIINDDDCHIKIDGAASTK